MARMLRNMTLQAGLSFDEFSATGAGIGLIRNCSAALVPVLADKMEQLFECVVMPTYARSESRFAHIVLVFLCFSVSSSGTQLLSRAHPRHAHRLEPAATTFTCFAQCRTSSRSPNGSQARQQLRTQKRRGRAANPFPPRFHVSHFSDPLHVTWTLRRGSRDLCEGRLCDQRI